MKDERSGGYGSDMDFVDAEAKKLQKALEDEPLTHEQIDETQRKAGERTEQGM